ncbi:uncharacterized protein N7511_003226 [Penicillium nucicola]|uniref:uncharacterized protein n=1 Tax=Penicillium nucicola TaxID=1850975 RepID=UPI002544D8B1|nr:uncharacterized protein N7511_003226 [Penicillium nucicola]KAJ5771175.1 hypothetical protein N7511_003226 [Penicillium nucicola]
MMLNEALERHLRWDNREPTPFISTYDSQDRAEQEADRRIDDKEAEVIIWEIVVTNNKGRDSVELVKARELATEVKLYIPKKAWNNSECEVLFWGRIARRHIAGYTKYTNSKGKLMNGDWRPLN